MSYVRRQLIVFCRWSLLSLLVTFQVVQVAYAQGVAQCVQYRFFSRSGGFNSGWHSSPSAACEALANALTRATANSEGARIYTGVLTQQGTNFYCYLPFRVPSTGGSNEDSPAPGSPANVQTNNCSLPCPSDGTTEVLNITTGWFLGPNDKDKVVYDTSPQFLTPTCLPAQGRACSASIVDVDKCWISLQPASNGLYRESCDFKVRHTGQSCTPTSTDTGRADPGAPPPPCPGVTGTVNGRTVCVPDRPTTSKTSPDGAGKKTTITTGNPQAGTPAGPISGRTPISGANNGNNGSSPGSGDGFNIPYGQGIPSDLGTPGGTASSSGGSGSGQQPTDCDKRPTSIGCSEFGTPVRDQELQTTPYDFNSITPVSFAGSAGCPAPVPFTLLGQTYNLNFTSICDNVVAYVRPLVLVVGAALAAFVFVAGFRS